MASSQALEEQIGPCHPDCQAPSVAQRPSYCHGPVGRPINEAQRMWLWQVARKKWPCSEGEQRRIINSTSSLPFQLAVSVAGGLTVSIQEDRQDKGMESGVKGQMPDGAVLGLIKRTITRLWNPGAERGTHLGLQSDYRFHAFL